MKEVKEKGIDGMEHLSISDLFRPFGNKVLVELIYGGSTYGNTGIIKLDGEEKAEPYVIIAAVSDKNIVTMEGAQLGYNNPLEPGAYALTRPEMSFQTFKLFNKAYALIDEYDITAVISEEIVQQIKDNIQNEVNKNKIQIVN